MKFTFCSWVDVGIDPYELCLYRTLSQDIDPYGMYFIELRRKVQYQYRAEEV